MHLLKVFIFKIAVTVSFLFLCLLTACSSTQNIEETSDTNSTEYHYVEERTELTAKPFPYEDFSEEYDTLQSYYTGETGDTVFLYQKEVSPEKTEQGSSEYLIHTTVDNTYEHHIIYYEEETNTYRELSLETENKRLEEIALAKDGTILLFYVDRAYLYHSEETVPYADFPADFRGGFLFTEENQIACKAHVSSPYFLFDLNTGDSCGEYLSADFLYGILTNYHTLLSESDASFLLVTGAGIYEKTEKEEWILKVPSQKTSMYKPGFYPCKVWKEQDCYLISDTDFTYCYNKVPVSDNEEILLKIVALEESDFIKESIINYQIEHPEITIEYEFLTTEKPESIQEYNTLLQKINAQMVSGQAGDIYLLDNLPWQSYQEKGYLTDLTELLSPYASSEDYFSNIIQGAANEKGIFAVPLHFDADGIYCRSDFAPYVKSLSTLSAYLQENPSYTGLAPYYYDSNIKSFFFPMLYHFYGHELYENGLVSEERLRNYLTDTKILYDRMKQSEQSMHYPYQEKYHASNYYVMSDMWQVVSYQAGNISLYISGERNVCFWSQTSHFEGYEMVGTGNFHPTMLLGLHTKAAENEDAKKLLQYLINCTASFNNKEKRMSNGIGIPVYKPAVGTWMENWRTFLTSQQELPNGYYLDSEYQENFPIYLPVAEDAVSYVDYLGTFHTLGKDANPLTDHVYAVMEENIDGYYEGTKSLEQTMDEIYSSVKLIQN